MPNILCTICIRKGSRGLPNKNIKSLKKKPLMAHTIKAALNSKIFDKIVISTDSNKISKIAKRYGAYSWFKRDRNLSHDYAPKVPVIRDALNKSEKYFKKKFHIVVDLDVTSPLRKIVDIKKSLKIFSKNNANNLITITKARKNPYFNMVEFDNGKLKICKKTINKITRRQDAPNVYEMNASIYIWKRSFLLKSDNIFNNKTSYYEMPEERSIDIDSELDFKIVKSLI